MHLITRALALPFVLLVGGAAMASDPVSESWQKKTREGIALLKRGDYNASLKLSQGVIRDMLERLGPGDAETRSFGIVLTHKALALAGLGRRDEALWEWHVALNLYPGLAKADLSPYGEPGKFLLANTELRKREDVLRADRRTANVKPPVAKKRVEPQYPGGAQSFRVSGDTVVEVIIDAQGNVSSPLVVKSLPAPTITYTALDALRRWKFEPGRVDGKPVNVVFNVTFNYSLR
jgi:protein TonB